MTEASANATAAAASLALKSYIKDSVAGWFVGPIKIVGILAQREGIRSKTEIKEVYAQMIAGLAPAIVRYCNESYHGYFQKSDAYVVKRLDGIPGKHPICTLHILLRVSLRWIELLKPYLGELDLSKRPDELYPMVNAFLEKHYDEIASGVTLLGEPCGACPNNGPYNPNEVVFSLQQK